MTSTTLSNRMVIGVGDAFSTQLTTFDAEHLKTFELEQFEWRILHHNDFNSQWILRQGRQLRFDPPKMPPPKYKQFNRRLMKCNRLKITE